MKKILLPALMVFCSLTGVYAQAPCTPDSEALNNSNGIVPDSSTNFVKGCLNQPYSQVISVRVPHDTTAAQLGGATVAINYVQVTGVNNLPPNFTYECMTPDCKFPGGSDGCAVVKGPADQIGVWQLNVTLKANVDLGITSVDQDMSDVNFWKIIVEDCNTNGLGINESSSFKVYPNPAFEKIAIVNLSEQNVMKDVKITNTTGQVVKSIFTNESSLEIDIADLPSGVYFIQIIQNGQLNVKKLMVE